MEHCAVIEEYANEIANEMAEKRELDRMIKTCISFNASREKILKMALEEFPQVPEQHISERISEIRSEFCEKNK